MNRGLAKRTVFLGLPEIRYFQSRLAREVRRGRIEVHAYCFLTTHFHLLLRSSSGHLSEVMRCVENSFVRWFNRRHRRDGSLFRGRFTSRLVDSEHYRKTVLRYIAFNPVSAGLVDSPEAYPHGSACHRIRADPPLWLSHDDPEANIDGSSRAGLLNSHAAWVIERRLEKRTSSNVLDDLIGATTGQVRRWMRAKAQLADGALPGSCLMSPKALRIAIAQARARDRTWSVAPGARKKDGWSVLELGMSRDLVGLSTAEAAMAQGIARSSAGHALLEHRKLLLTDSKYCERAARILEQGLQITFGEGTLSGATSRDGRVRLECMRDRT